MQKIDIYQGPKIYLSLIFLQNCNFVHLDLQNLRL